MTDFREPAGPAATLPGSPDPALVTLTHVIYALHGLSVVIGIVSAATIVGAFVFGVPSIVAVILNYVKRGEVRGTFLESHFRWQIRTFWFAFLWAAIGGILFVTIVGIPLAFAVFFGVGIWVIYRLVRGWLALRGGQPMPSGG
jgi:uncharacterized membrane protein